MRINSGSMLRYRARRRSPSRAWRAPAGNATALRVGCGRGRLKSIGSDSIDRLPPAIFVRLAISATSLWFGAPLQLRLNLALEAIIAQHPGLVGRLANLGQAVLGNPRAEQLPVSRLARLFIPPQPAVFGVQIGRA